MMKCPIQSVILARLTHSYSSCKFNSKFQLKELLTRRQSYTEHQMEIPPIHSLLMSTRLRRNATRGSKGSSESTAN